MNMFKGKLGAVDFADFAALMFCHATEGPFIKDGGQCILSTAADFRNSTLTGTTLSGPSGSGQFLAVVLSTTVGRTCQLPSTVSAQFKAYGICQNKPRAGEAIDVVIFGISKVVAGSTTIANGQDLVLSSTAAGTLIGFSTAVGTTPIGRSLEAPTAIGQVFTAAIYGFGVGPPGGV